MNRLQELVLRRLEELGEPGHPLSYKAASLQSHGRVNHETIRKIAIGVHSNRISDPVAEGLAAALRVPVEQVYRAAEAPRPGPRWKWPERFDRLNDDERRVVESVAAALLAAHDHGRRG